jgi:hypothetical protein
LGESGTSANRCIPGDIPLGKYEVELARVMGEHSDFNLGLNEGFNDSHWASDRRPIIPTRKEKELLREAARRKQENSATLQGPLPQDVVPSHLREVSAKDGLPVLTIDTKVPQDDNIDGDSTESGTQ